MNLYRLELKRVCKTRMTAILLAIALVLAVVMAYLPVTFIGWTELDASGNEVRYTGLKAIRKRQEQQVSDTITPDVMQEALEAYQRVYRQYDASSINDIPVEVFYKELARYQPLVNNAKEAFADSKTGMAPGVMGLTAEDMQNFYSQLPKRLESVIWLEQSGKPGYEQAQAIAQKKFDAVQKPFTYSFGVSSDAMDYQTLLSLLLTLLCAVIADFGYNQSDRSQVDFPYKKSHFDIASDDSVWSRMQLAIGQGTTTVTPLLNLMIYAAIANDGVMMTPYLVDH